MSKMTKADRAELKSLLLRRFRTLKGDVSVRVTELKAEAEAALDATYQDEDRAVRELDSQINGVMERARANAERIMLDASNEVQTVFDIFVEANPNIRVELARSGRDGVVNHWRPIRHEREARKDRLRTLFAELDAAAAAAKQRLDTQEVEMRTVLAVETLETDHAKKFLDQIPTVGELVPASRLDGLMTGSAPKEIDHG